MNIYEISRNYLQLIDELQEQGGELTPELENALKINKQDFENKAEAYCQIIINLNAEIDGLNNECVRLAEKRDRAKKAVERLKDNLTNAMLLFDCEKKSSHSPAGAWGKKNWWEKMLGFVAPMINRPKAWADNSGMY